MDCTNETTNAQRLAERRLLAAAWAKPSECARVCGSLDLRYMDFADRLVGIVVGYIRQSADAGTAPDLDEAERILSERAVPRSPGELYAILQEPTAGESIPDLALAVQQSADERTSELCRSLTREAFRAWSHTFNCRDCIRCSQAKPSPPRLRIAAPRARKAWRLQYERSNAIG